MKIIVIGGGASGLTSAITAARNGASVTILERNNTCGKKILVTGNGKCNYYNEDQNITHYHSTNKEIIPQIINEENLKKVTEFIKSLGIVPKIKNGYYYPFSNQAISILNSLLTEINNLNVNIISNTTVMDIEKRNDKFIVKTEQEKYLADKVILATGSNAYYKHPLINSYNLLEKLNHKIIKPLPALVQLRTDDNITKKWGGIRVDAKLKLFENDKFIKEETGELMLTSYGISGICAMQLSGIIAKSLDNDQNNEIEINFVNQITEDPNEFIEYLDNLAKSLTKRTISNILDNILNYKLGNALLEKIKLDSSKEYQKLSKQEKINLANNIIKFKLKITGTNGFNEAQVSSGGLTLLEINPKTMESKKVNNLYIAGEILDIDGDCGGYNLTNAWITGIIAGTSASEEKND